MATVTRMYQLGGSSTFEARDREHLLRIIAKDARQQRQDGDCQGIAYSVATPAAARAVGAYETVDGAWAIEGTDIDISVEEEEEEADDLG